MSFVEEAGVPTSLAGGAAPLPLCTEAVECGPWGALVRAPDDEAGMTAARASMAALVDRRPSCVAVYGGTDLTRVLLSEHARLRHDLPSVLIEHDIDRDGAVTAVLSGRADLVALDAAMTTTGRSNHDQPDQ